MDGVPSDSRVDVYTIGQLCIDGDWACMRGDFPALRDVVEQLASHVPEPRHCELRALAEQCISAPRSAIESWQRLKAQLFRGAK